MKDRIKKILKEDMDWVKDHSTNLDWEEFVKEHGKWAHKGFLNDSDKVREMLEIKDYLAYDPEHMVDLAHIVTDDSGEYSKEARQKALDEYGSYAMLGDIIEKTQMYLDLVVGFSEHLGIDEEEAGDIILTYYKDNLHKTELPDPRKSSGSFTSNMLNNLRGQQD